MQFNKLTNTLVAFAAASNAIRITQAGTNGDTTGGNHVQEFALALAKYSLYDVDLAQLDDQIKA